MKNLQGKKLFLFDIDGVIRVGDNFIEGALELFNYINKIGGKSIFITNNSSKSNSDYVDYFKENHFDVESDNFITSMTVTVNYLLKHHKNDIIYLVGTKSLKDELIKNNLKITEKYSLDVDVILIANDTEFTFDKIANACRLLQEKKEITYLATHPDLRCPIDYGYYPDCGSIAKMIELTTEKTPKYLGKPAPNMVEVAIEQTGYSKEEAIVIGDRLYTDIACGINAGVDTCVVFTGEVQKKDMLTAKEIPTYQFDSVKELLEAYKK